MAAAALLRSVASKMTRAAAPVHHRSLVARGRGLHGGARSGPPATYYSLHSNQVQVLYVVLPSIGEVWFETLTSYYCPHYLFTIAIDVIQQGTVWNRGLHSRASPDLIPSTPPKVLPLFNYLFHLRNPATAIIHFICVSLSSFIQVLHTTALAKATAGLAYVTLFGTAIYLHFWTKPAQEKAIAMIDSLYKQRSDLINTLESITHAQREMLVKLQNMHVSSVSRQAPGALASGILTKQYQNFFLFSFFFIESETSASLRL